MFSVPAGLMMDSESIFITDSEFEVEIQSIFEISPNSRKTAVFAKLNRGNIFLRIGFSKKKISKKLKIGFLAEF
jgi:hypothetical protein